MPHSAWCGQGKKKKKKKTPTPHQKTKVVQVYFKDGGIMTVEQALKENKISLELLDKYEVEYIKKEK